MSMNKPGVKYNSPTKQQHGYKSGSPQIPTINTSRESLTRRIWIRKPEGSPTSLYVKESDLIDDLKSMIMQKFPLSLAKTCDPADLVIRLEPPVPNSPNYYLSPTNQKFFTPTSAGVSSSSSGYSPSFNSPISPIPVSATKHSSLIPQKPPISDFSNFSIQSSSPLNVVLEADRPIWNILDQYYPNGMGMDNAFIIDLPDQHKNHHHHQQHGHGHSHGHHSLEHSTHGGTTPNGTKKYPAGTITEEKEDDDMGFLQASRRMNSLPSHNSPFSSLRSTPTSYHRRSQSNPTDQSSAVLLLPKDYSTLNETVRKAYNDSVSSRADSVYSMDRRTLSPSTSDQTLHPPNQQPASTFPKADSTGSTKKKEENSTIAKVLPSVNVLIVEDNLINLRILSAHLRRHKIHYDIAKNGQEAIDKWRKGGFHLVLMDIQLPVMSGLGASKEIRRLEKINRIGVFANSDLQNMEPQKPEDQLDLNVFRSPVIIVALTASTMKQDKQQALAAGCNDYLTKPVNLDWLLNKITEWGCMQALIDFDGWKSGERMTNISAAIPTLARKRSSSRRLHSHEIPTNY